MEENEKTFGDKLKEYYQTKQEDTVEIKLVIPKQVLKRLDYYAKKNAGNSYWCAIDHLLFREEEKINVNEMVRVLADRDDMISFELQRLKEEISLLKNTDVKPERKHFGRKEGE